MSISYISITLEKSYFPVFQFMSILLILNIVFTVILNHHISLHDVLVSNIIFPIVGINSNMLGTCEYFPLFSLCLNNKQLFCTFSIFIKPLGIKMWITLAPILCFCLTHGLHYCYSFSFFGSIKMRSPSFDGRTHVQH